MTVARPQLERVATAGSLGVAACAVLLLLSGAVRAQEPGVQDPTPGSDFALLLGGEEMPVDLLSALKLAGVGNPQILLARQRVVEAMVLHQFAAAQILPSLHLGGSYDDHNGNLQQSSGNILKVDRNNVYFGAGANAIAAGTVSVPGVFWSGNVAEGVYAALVAKQVVVERRFNSRAVENDMLRRVGNLYTELLRTEGRRAIAVQVAAEAGEVETLSAAFLKAGAGRKSDADRARTERLQRQAELVLAEGNVLLASDRLAELLNIPPTIRLRPVDEKVIPCAIVPDVIPLRELLAIAVLNRPELQARQAVIREALLYLEGARMLPFAPTVLLGLSYGGEGGGSNIVAQPVGTTPFTAGQPRFQSPRERLDFDAIAYWSLENLAVGNRGRNDVARARLGIAQLQSLEQLNRVRTQVASAYARSQSRLAQIATTEQAVREAKQTYGADVRAIRGGVGLPIELLESLRLHARARYAYLDAIADYNEAEIDLLVALGQPPAATLARPVPLDVDASVQRTEAAPAPR